MDKCGNTGLRLTETGQRWLEHVQACERLGQSMQAYALDHGLNVQSFYKWKSDLRRQGFLDGSPSPPEAVCFQKVEWSVTTASAGGFRVRLPNGLELEWDRTPDPEILPALIAAIGVH